MKTAQPKIKHVDGRATRILSRAVVRSFLKEVEKDFDRRMAALGPFMQAPTDASILKERKELVQKVKIGMLDRKDQEIQIAVQAMIVWWMRLEKERRDQMIADTEWNRP
jgi:hypothetical protein